jgi:hypothetical protein
MGKSAGSRTLLAAKKARSGSTCSGWMFTMKRLGASGGRLVCHAAMRS